MNWIVFSIKKEQGVFFINSLPDQYWHDNKIRFFKKEHNCSILAKFLEKEISFVISSTHEDFTSFITKKLTELTIDYTITNEIEDTSDYEFVVSKELDQNYLSSLEQQVGSIRLDTFVEKYLNANIAKKEHRLEKVFTRLLQNDFEVSALVATSYLEELIKESFNSFNDLDSTGGYKRFKMSTTHGFRIAYLYSRGYIDKKTHDVLNNLRDIRNVVAHQAVLEAVDRSIVKEHLNRIKNICDNGLLYRPNIYDNIKDEELKFLVMVTENLSLAFLQLNQYINPFKKIAKIFYANKGYGKGFSCAVTAQYIDWMTLWFLENRCYEEKIGAKEFHRHGVFVNF
ncbi:hypothetical protein ACQKCH_03905 [Nubsella zeaxanthinifaciens]|uniref:hypothetical protein n=1 Tax=Nubsella zeaxanthinifaciens TaxID=392412 RepID=UPI003D022E79